MSDEIHLKCNDCGTSYWVRPAPRSKTDWLIKLMEFRASTDLPAPCKSCSGRIEIAEEAMAETGKVPVMYMQAESARRMTRVEGGAG